MKTHSQRATKPPRVRQIIEGVDARQMVDAAIHAHWDYHEMINTQQKHLDGNPPFDPDKLRSKNLSWMHNRNYGKATAQSEKLVAQKIFNVVGGFSFGYPVFEVFDAEKHSEDAPWLNSDEQRDHYSNAMRIAYATTLEKEDRVYDMVSKTCFYATNWGIGFITRDNDDWLGFGQNLTDVFFPRAQEFNEVDTFITFGERSIQWFFEKLDSGVDNSPWNEEALKDLMIWSLGPNWMKSIKNRDRRWERILASYEDFATQFSRDTRMVRFAKIWNEELSGGVTETYVFYTGDETDFITSEILFQTHYPNRCIFDFIEHFRDNPITSTGVVQNMRGLARFSVPDSHHFNVKRNAIEDKIMVAGNMQFKQNARNQGEKFNMHVTSVATILPVGYEPVENQRDPRLQDHIQAITLDEANYQRETAHYDPSLRGRLGDRATTREVDQQATEVNRLQNAKDLVLREDWGRFHKNCLARLAYDNYKEGDRGYEGQKRFYKEFARAAGITIDEAKEIAQYIEDFEMSPVLGDEGALKEAIDITPDPYRKNELVRQLLYLKGYSRNRIEFLRPRMSRFDIVSGEAQLADLQNSMFWDQQLPLYNPNDDPKTALDVHYQRFDEAIQGASEGADPVRVLNYLRTGLAFVRNHLDTMKGSALYGEERVKPYESKYKGYQRILGQLEELAERAARKQQEQQPQPMSEEDRARMSMEMWEHQQHEQRREENQQSERQRREESHRQQLRHREEQQDATIRAQMADQIDMDLS